MHPESSNSPRLAIEFKSSSVTLPALIIINDDMALIEEQLKQKIQQAPEFFKHSPIVVDLQQVPRLSLPDLLQTLRALELNPVALRGGATAQIKTAKAEQLAILAEQRTTPSHATKSTTPPAPPNVREVSTTRATPETKLLTQPVRSGQRIYATGDLIVLATVSAGAEIMAEGNIHVYGCLRGRALAGVQGDTRCRIFCSDLQAELVSIAGHYRVSEDLSPHTRGKPVQIYLDEHALFITEL